MKGWATRLGANFVNLLVILLETLGVGCWLVSAALTYQEVGEINRKLPEDQQMSYFFFHLEKMIKISREYRRLYPHSSIDQLRYVLVIVGTIFLALAGATMGFFRH